MCARGHTLCPTSRVLPNIQRLPPRVLPHIPYAPGYPGKRLFNHITFQLPLASLALAGGYAR